MGRPKGQGAQTASNYDYLLIFAVVLLLVIGLWMVYSVTEFQKAGGYDDSEAEGGLFGSRFLTQVIASLIGIVSAFALARIEYHSWRRYSIPIMLLTLLFLGAVLVFGDKENGALSWFLNGSIQPSEAAKLAMIMYVAHWLSSKGDRIQRLTYGLLPFTVILAAITGLILAQNDFGTAALVALTALAMFFIAGGAIGQLVLVAVGAGTAAIVAVATVAHRMERVVSFVTFDATGPLNPGGDLYQLKQGLLALSLGGVSGRGLGDSIQKMGWIPAAHTDSIFAVLGEEMGLIGCLVVLGLFAVVAYRGFSIALRATDQYGTLLAAGVTCSLLFQALVNIGVVTATIPTTGVPLPFISYGGSSLAVSLASIGLLLSVSRRTLPEPEKEEPAQPTLKESHAYHETYDLGRRHGRARLSRSDRRRLVNKR